MKRPPIIATIIGTGFGSGFWPWGPGTAGALLATLIWLGLASFMSPAVLLCVTLALCFMFTILGTWAANQLSPYWGNDPSRVVIDEMVGVWIPLSASPAGDLRYAAAAFLLFRFFDILKPLGIRSLDRKAGGFWVMADDILAGIYSLIIIAFIRWAV